MSRHLAEFKALNRWLAALWGRGLGESHEADAVREVSDGPWYAMSEAEKDEARAYSAEVEDEPLPEGVTMAAVAAGLGVPAERWAEIEEAVAAVPPQR